MIEIQEIGAADLPRYARVPIAFTVKEILQVELADGGFGGICLRQASLDAPYLKDYDAADDGPPEAWLRCFDVSRWAFFLAVAGEQPVGGATVAFNTSGVNLLEGRDDIAVLWDIRVHPDWRGRGVGRALFQRAADWARGRDCRLLKIETQNINLAACRFYARQGCQLGAINRYGYFGQPACEHEAMLLWYLHL